MYNVSLNNAETSGSIAYRAYNKTSNCPPETPNCSSVNFKGRDDYYEEKGGKAAKVIIGLAAAAAVVIGGLGIAHKKDVLSKIKNDKVKDILSKAQPAAEKCYEWCSKAKDTGLKGWEKLKSIFKKKS